MQDEFLLDSNILVYAFDSSAGRKHEIAAELLEDCFRGQKFCVSLQNLAEFFVIVTKKIERPITVEEASDVVNLLINFNGFRKLAPTAKTIQHAMKLSECLPFWDAMIVSVMLENNIRCIYTENVKDFQIGCVQAVDPFACEST